MRPRAKTLATATLAFATLAFAAGAPGQPPPGDRHSHGASCFYVRDVNNFTAPDEETVYLRVGVSQVYRLKLFAQCLDVDWVHHLALFTHSDPWVCEGRGLNVDVGVRQIGLGRQRCPVDDVRKLTPQEVAAIPTRDRP